MLNRRRRVDPNPRTRGFSLIESICALVVAVSLMMPVVGILRSSVDIWESADSRQGRTAHLYGTLRHVQKHIRESSGIISIGSNNGVVLACRDSAGQACQWSFDIRQRRISYSAGAGTGPVSEHIHEIRCEGFDQNRRALTQILAGDLCLSSPQGDVDKRCFVDLIASLRLTAVVHGQADFGHGQPAWRVLQLNISC